MPYDHLLVETGAVATLTMNRPERRNALSLAMMRELITAMRQLAGDEQTRAIILAGNGPAFSAGHDLREMIGRDLPAYREVFDVCTELMQTVQAIPQPVIARCTPWPRRPAASWSRRATSRSPAPARGSPHRGSTSPVLHDANGGTDTRGRRKRRSKCCSPERRSTRRPRRSGAGEPRRPGRRSGRRHASAGRTYREASSFTVALGKQAFYTQIDLDQAKAYAYAKEVMSMNALAADAQEGMSAFVEKRPPCWVGR